jgi:hypothetical protein
MSLPAEPLPTVEHESDLADDEVRELDEQLAAAVYLFGSKLIITSLVDMTEIGSVTVLSASASPDEIGRAICRHLDEYRDRETDELEYQEIEDTEAFAASGAASIEQFCTEAYFARAHTFTGSLIFEAQPLSESRQSTGFYAAIAMDIDHTDGEIGRVALKAFEAAAILKCQGAFDERLPRND